MLMYRVQAWTPSSIFFFFSSRRRHTRLQGDWSSDVCSSDLSYLAGAGGQDSRLEGDRLLRNGFRGCRAYRKRSADEQFPTAHTPALGPVGDEERYFFPGWSGLDPAHDKPQRHFADHVVCSADRYRFI